jgi:capsular polysaccharide biosynthesis protein
MTGTPEYPPAGEPTSGRTSRPFPFERDHEPVGEQDRGAPPDRGAGPPVGSQTPRDDRPPLVGSLEAVVRHPLLASMPLVVLVAAALFFGLTREPTYTAHARLSVGSVNVPAYVLQTVILGNQTLAASYARAVENPRVVSFAARRAGLPKATVRNDLSATAVPESTLIRIDADADSRAKAIKLANFGALALTTYLAKVNRVTEPARLLRKFRRAQDRVEVTRSAVRRAYKRRKPDEIRRARVRYQAATLETTDLGERYRASQVNGAPAQAVKPIAPAVDASSDRDSMLERLLLIAAAAGLIVGVALALLAANWGRLRTT